MLSIECYVMNTNLSRLGVGYMIVYTSLKIKLTENVLLHGNRFGKM